MVAPLPLKTGRSGILCRQAIRSLTFLLLLFWLVGCGSTPLGQQATPTPSLSSPPTQGPSPSPWPTMSPPSNPTMTPAPEAPLPSATPTQASVSLCAPPLGVKPVSAVQINRGNPHKRRVAITIDPFGTEEMTLHFLDILALHQVHATWFPEGSEALQGPERIRHVQAYGDEIGNHAMHHPHVMTLSDDAVCQEILEAEQALASITGQTTRPYFRPPMERWIRGSGNERPSWAFVRCAGPLILAILYQKRPLRASWTKCAVI